MRKITQEAINAFINGEDYSKDNTRVQVENVLNIESGKSGLDRWGERVNLYLYGNKIAKYMKGTSTIEISNAGWLSPTTKERLNGIPGVSIQQKKGEWYLNGVKWDGKWITI